MSVHNNSQEILAAVKYSWAKRKSSKGKRAVSGKILFGYFQSTLGLDNLRPRYPRLGLSYIEILYDFEM